MVMAALYHIDRVDLHIRRKGVPTALDTASRPFPNGVGPSSCCAWSQMRTGVGRSRDRKGGFDV